MAVQTLTESEVATQLKSAVYLMVAKIVEEELGENVSSTPSFLASLVELVYNQLINLGEDLELFANHANRSVIRPADLYMVTRKNDILTKALKDYEDQLK
ncbi:uncharacterized protein PRCAT00000886001 [Priceomyces carsonii]|uniref:uncharacterized protein n=1 Tax=Priceomyces carsonii TaxID=28549 RepID=UPI002ED7C65C|nr:unnamed protein product [Priceomyces carsonii]